MRGLAVAGSLAICAGCGDTSGAVNSVAPVSDITLAEIALARVVKSAKGIAHETPLDVAADCSLVATEIFRSLPQGLKPLKFADGSSIAPEELMETLWLEVASHHGFSGSYADLAAESRYFDGLHNGGSASVENFTKNNPHAKDDLEKCNDSMNIAGKIIPRPTP